MLEVSQHLISNSSMGHWKNNGNYKTQHGTGTKTDTETNGVEYRNKK
jgi:hypothetical protein